jgi:hypothetical protein
MTSDITRPSQLWKPLSTERKLQAAEAFWRDGEASLEHAEAIALLTQRLKFRAKSVVALPVEKRRGIWCRCPSPSWSPPGCSSPTT